MKREKNWAWTRFDVTALRNMIFNSFRVLCCERQKQNLRLSKLTTGKTKTKPFFFSNFTIIVKFYWAARSCGIIFRMVSLVAAGFKAYFKFIAFVVILIFFFFFNLYIAMLNKMLSTIALSRVRARARTDTNDASTARKKKRENSKWPHNSFPSW